MCSLSMQVEQVIIKDSSSYNRSKLILSSTPGLHSPHKMKYFPNYCSVLEASALDLGYAVAHH